MKSTGLMRKALLVTAQLGIDQLGTWHSADVALRNRSAVRSNSVAAKIEQEPASANDDSGGCGCRATRSRAGSSIGAAAVGLLGLGLRRSRRRGR